MLQSNSWCPADHGSQHCMVGLRAPFPVCGGICRVVQITNHQFRFIYFFFSSDKVESSLRWPHGGMLASNPLGTVNQEAVSKRKGRRIKISLKVVENGSILSSRAMTEVTSHLSYLWFLSVVAIFFGYWPVSFSLLFLLFPAGPIMLSQIPGRDASQKKSECPLA